MNDLSVGQPSNSEILRAVSSLETNVVKEVADVKAGMNRLEVHMEGINVRNRAADDLHHDHEGRIRDLEKVDFDRFIQLETRVEQLIAFRYKLAGMSSLLSLLLGAAGIAIGHFIF